MMNGWWDNITRSSSEPATGINGLRLPTDTPPLVKSQLLALWEFVEFEFCMPCLTANKYYSFATLTQTVLVLNAPFQSPQSHVQQHNLTSRRNHRNWSDTQRPKLPLGLEMTTSRNAKHVSYIVYETYITQGTK